MSSTKPTTKPSAEDPEEGRVDLAHLDRVNLGQLLRQRTRLDPDRAAIVSVGVTRSYSDLERRSNQLADSLRVNGVREGDQVSLLMTNRLEFFEIFFACAKLGARLVPINYRLVAKEVAFILQDSGTSALFYSDDLAETARAACDDGVLQIEVADGTGSSATSYDTFLEAGDPTPRVCAANLDDDVAIIYTSGTTGRPKGAVLSHGNLLFTSFNQIIDFEVRADDRTLVAAPLYHVGGMLVLTLPTLHVGGTVYLHRSFDPAAVLESLVNDRIDTVFLAPTMWKMLLAQPGLDDLDFDALRLCVSGGESLPVPIIEQLTSTFGEGFVEGYGLTEAASCTTVLRARDILNKPGSVGMPFLHNSVKVIGPDGTELGQEEAGEVIQSGPTVMRGYWERPDANAETLSDGWLRTGDIGVFDEDGFLHIVDRAKDMIISGAENVYPAEVEQLLYRHPEIEEVAVIGLPDPQWGEAVTAVVVPTEGSQLTEDTVIEYCRPLIAGYKRPRRVLFTDVLPRNPSGKVLKNELRESYAD